jgi:hypothetical protein
MVLERESLLIAFLIDFSKKNVRAVTKNSIMIVFLIDFSKKIFGSI